MLGAAALRLDAAGATKRWYGGMKRHLANVLLALASGAATIGVLLLVNAGIERLETGGQVDTYQGADDSLFFVDGPLFETRPDGTYQTTRYAELSMVRSRFAIHKGNAWRAFVLGESFAMGTPYAQQGEGRDKPGGIPSFLQAELAAVMPDRPVEVINAGAGAQNSARVRRIAEQVVEFAPDLLLVMTCNNEGVLPPGRIAETLHRFGAVRLLDKVLSPTAGKARSYYTPQDPDTSRVREVFRDNVHAILERASEKGIHVLLTTLPVNLRYEGSQLGHVIDGKWEEPVVPACVAEGKRLREQERLDQAVSVLNGCDSVEALREIGLVEYARGRYDEARRALEQYTELVPRNRCRPSFNALLRDAAAAYDNVRLVDLAAKADALSPHGIAGSELFDDYCHMNWIGYAAMADEVIAALTREGWIPHGEAVPPSREELRVRFGLEENPAPRER